LFPHSSKKANKPVALFTKIGLAKTKSVAAKTIEASTKNVYYRPELAKIALAKYAVLSKVAAKKN
jgi:hypothetical protein